MRWPASTCACRTLATCEKGLWEDSVDSMERDLRSFGFFLQLLLMLGSLNTQARNDCKAIAVSQGVPNRVHNFCCELRQTKSSSQPKVLLSPISGSCSKTALKLLEAVKFLELDSELGSSPTSVVKINCMVFSSLHGELDTENVVCYHGQQSSARQCAPVFVPKASIQDAFFVGFCHQGLCPAVHCPL